MVIAVHEVYGHKLHAVGSAAGAFDVKFVRDTQRQQSQKYRDVKACVLSHSRRRRAAQQCIHVYILYE